MATTPHAGHRYHKSVIVHVTPRGSPEQRDNLCNAIGACTGFPIWPQVDHSAAFEIPLNLVGDFTLLCNAAGCDAVQQTIA